MKFEEFDNDKISACIRDLEQVLAKHSMSVGELVLAYGNLGYKLGANIRRQTMDKNFVSEPPDIELLNKLYYLGATIDIALMINALHVASWIEDLDSE